MIFCSVHSNPHVSAVYSPFDWFIFYVFFPISSSWPPCWPRLNVFDLHIVCLFISGELMVERSLAGLTHLSGFSLHSPVDPAFLELTDVTLLLSFVLLPFALVEDVEWLHFAQFNPIRYTILQTLPWQQC